MFKSSFAIVESSSSADELQEIENCIVKETPKCLLKYKSNVINLISDDELNEELEGSSRVIASSPIPLKIKPSFSKEPVEKEPIEIPSKKMKRLQKRKVEDLTCNSTASNVESSVQTEEDVSILSFINQTDSDELQFVFDAFEIDFSVVLQKRPFEEISHFENFVRKECKLTKVQLERLKSSIFSTVSLGKLLERIERICKNSMDTFHLLSQERILSSSSNDQFKLKSYQLYGISWMNNLFINGLGGILADEMGLGKTVQVISLVSYLINQGIDYGPFLVICPSSTMDNWFNEFKKWAAHIKIIKYYGTIEERFDLRDRYGFSNWNVIITTFSMGTSSKEDRKFLRKIQPSILFVDEAHFLKNCQSQKYISLFSIPSQHKILLTGTPLQNGIISFVILDLLELFSLFQFIIPDNLNIDLDQLKELFALNASRKNCNKSNDICIRKIKKLIEPFVLRRKKSDVLSDLPQKEEQVISCEMTRNQVSISEEFIKNQTKYNNNILIHLRKAANHPLMFRRRYTDATLRIIANQLFCELDFSTYSSLDDIEQELALLNDYEIHSTCAKYPKRLSSHLLLYDAFLDSGKTSNTLSLVQSILKSDPDGKILIFSQFIIILDILSDVFDYHSIPFHRLDGSMAVSDRQSLMNSFNNNENIKIFLLSSKAAGFGINLVSANYVIIHDIDYNPHNDKQAEDRCHRIGQTKTVKIYKLISKDSVEEKVLDIAEFKIKLDKKFQ